MSYSVLASLNTGEGDQRFKKNPGGAAHHRRGAFTSFLPMIILLSLGFSVCVIHPVLGEDSSSEDEVFTLPEFTVTDTRLRTDYAWVAKSLGRRVATLNRYPSAARRYGWEGRVVLRVVITSDGELKDVAVQKSSGYEALDQAAKTAVRLACPLPLQHKINRPEIGITLPVVYRLSR